MGIYLGLSQYSESGYEQRGPLLTFANRLTVTHGRVSYSVIVAPTMNSFAIAGPLTRCLGNHAPNPQRFVPH